MGIMLSSVYIHYSIVQLVITPTGASMPSKWCSVANIRRTRVMGVVMSTLALSIIVHTQVNGVVPAPFQAVRIIHACHALLPIARRKYHLLPVYLRLWDRLGLCGSNFCWLLILQSILVHQSRLYSLGCSRHWHRRRIGIHSRTK